MSIPKILTSSDLTFPVLDNAMVNPNGLLAIGGELSQKQLMSAYQQGIFPWYNKDQPILWWSPDPRAVLYLNELKVSRSLQKVMRRQIFKVTWNQAFLQVINACAQPRKNQTDTWLSEEMIIAYANLHKAGFAHSMEVWLDDRLVGGIYGVDCGRVFAGESMFSLVSNASKVAFVFLVHYLREHNYVLLDCQIISPFLQQFGVKEISRSEFIEELKCFR